METISEAVFENVVTWAAGLSAGARSTLATFGARFDAFASAGCLAPLPAASRARANAVMVG
jgi:hypothetical protein